MDGRVDRAGRALVDISLRRTPSEQPSAVAIWIDTVFTGELVLSRRQIEKLGLVQSSAVSAGLADGKQVILETFSCVVDWFGEQRQVEAVESEGLYALLGTGLLDGHKLEIDYRLRTLTIV